MRCRLELQGTIQFETIHSNDESGIAGHREHLGNGDCHIRWEPHRARQTGAQLDIVYGPIATRRDATVSDPGEGVQGEDLNRTHWTTLNRL